MYDLTKHYNYNRKEILSKINSVLNKGLLELGPEVDNFEKNFSNYCNAKYCVTVSSGSMGLLLAVKSLNLKNTDEIITVANSDIPTSHAISLSGAKIVWVDVEEDSFNIDPKEIISSLKKGIYAVNFSGGQVDITNGKFVFSASEAYLVEDGKIKQPLKGATLIGNGPDAMSKISLIGNDLALDDGIGTCGKDGQDVPVGVGQPTLLMGGITIGGTQTN